MVATLTTPPIIGLIGTLLRRLKGSRHVYWSMDLHPDASLALGRMSPRNPVVAWLAWLSDVVYRQADKVVVLGPYMADRIAAKGVRRDRLATIPVWSRRDEIYPLPREGHELRASLGLADKFVAMYSGNLGLAHSFDEVIEAARRLRDRDDIVFLFVGGGPRLAEVRAAKEAEGLDNVRLLDYFPREQLHASLSVADVHLISMRAEMTGIVVPGKLYGAMASGRPTVFVGPGHCESADTIRQADCGLTVRLGDADGLVEALTGPRRRPRRRRRDGPARPRRVPRPPREGRLLLGLGRDDRRPPRRARRPPDPEPRRRARSIGPAHRPVIRGSRTPSASDRMMARALDRRRRNLLAILRRRLAARRARPLGGRAEDRSPRSRRPTTRP